MGILGMVFAATGGIAWFFQQIVFALLLWGASAIILFKLNKKQNNRIRKKDRRR